MRAVFPSLRAYFPFKNPRHPSVQAASLAFLATMSGGLSVAAAQDQTPPAPTVVELFTSQSCSSCPSAEKNFVTLADRSDVIALEWHVDYWDDLQVGRAGRWKDPYSNASHTKRQREYNYQILGNRRVYTPQAVVNGRYETVGSRAKALDTLIEKASRDEIASSITANRRDGKIYFRVSTNDNGQEIEANAVLVTFAPSVTTRVRGGENNGRTLAEANVVTDATNLGPILNQDAMFSIEPPDTNSGCALLVEDTKTNQILAGAYCPS